jgi:type III pantothenate kinase
MILALDVGNTNIELRGGEDGRTLFVYRFATAKGRTCDEYAMLFRLAAEQRGVDLKKAEGAIISSVVPQLNSILCRAVKAASGKEPIMLGPGVKTGLNIRIDDPSELGGNFVAAAVAAGAFIPPAVRYRRYGHRHGDRGYRQKRQLHRRHNLPRSHAFL